MGFKYYQREDFDTIYRKYFPDVVQYIYFHIRNLADAEDMTQEVFLIFYQNMQNMECRMDAIRLWLFFCAYRQINSYLRIKYKMKDYSSDIPLEEVGIEENSQISISELSSILTTNEMHYVYLSFYCGLSNIEIREIMNMSITSLRRMKKSSIKKIKIFMEKINRD